MHLPLLSVLGGRSFTALSKRDPSTYVDLES